MVTLQAKELIFHSKGIKPLESRAGERLDLIYSFSVCLFFLVTFVPLWRIRLWGGQE